MLNESNPLNVRPAAQASAETPEPVREIDPLRINTESGQPIRDHCSVVVEDVLTIKVEDVGNFELMCTPTDTVALAVGFLLAEDMIASAKEIVRLLPQSEPHIVTVRIEDPEQVVAGRNLVVTSSCGMCGSRNIFSFMEGLRNSRDTLRIAPSVFRTASQHMCDRQALFARTGGTHAAAIFSADGEVVSMGEDIGRHNALDKAIGKCLLESRSVQGHGVILSGRISLEMLAKAAQAGLEIVAGISAPTSMAVDMAERLGITLCGFVREDRATVYTHAHRIHGADVGA